MKNYKPKPGDLVMFTDSGRYSKWFWGKLGTLKSVTTNSVGVDYCSISWLVPVSYFGKYTTISSFKLSSFEVYNIGK